MATTDERVDKIEIRVGSLEQQVSAVTAKVDTFIGEMRDRDNQRVAEIKALNAKIDSKFDSLSTQIHNLTIAAVVGFGAIALAVGGLVATALK